MNEWLRDAAKYPRPATKDARWKVTYTRRTSMEGETDDFDEMFITETDARAFATELQKEYKNDVLDMHVTPITALRCCCDCEECTHDGTWRIYILKEFWGEYPQICEPYCTHCMEEELEGVHTGGGLTEAVIDRIERIIDSEAAQLVREWHVPLKTLDKMIAIVKQQNDPPLLAKLEEIKTLNDSDKMNRWFGFYQCIGQGMGYWSLEDVIKWVREEKTQQ